MIAPELALIELFLENFPVVLKGSFGECVLGDNVLLFMACVNLVSVKLFCKFIFLFNEVFYICFMLLLGILYCSNTLGDYFGMELWS